MTQNKPRRPSGMYCPLWKKDVSKVCHTCDWWQSLAVQDQMNPTTVRAEWQCAVVLSVIAQRSMHSAIDGVQAATESFRNEMVRISAEEYHARPQNSIGATPHRLIDGD